MTDPVDVPLKDDAEDKPLFPPDEVTRLPTIYADNYWLSWWPGHIKIAFGEAFGEKSQFRTAVVLEPETIDSLIKDLQEAQEKLVKLKK